jgi:DNA-binding MarR family transcriptional regulator/GNAT superfamily N-acetyltransferase
VSDVERIRAFNRRWTEVIGLLDAGLLDTPYSLPEARMLFELGRHRDEVPCEQIELRRRLRMDPSYLTRVVARLKRAGLVTTQRSDVDRRHVRLALTPDGRAVAAELDRRSAAQISSLLEPLSEDERRRVGAAIDTLDDMLNDDPGADRQRSVTVRGLGSGDLGWVIQRHGEIYHDEYGWDISFEALVAEIAAKFLASFDASRERCWIAEIEGVQVGSIFLVRHTDDVAKLRLLLVEPAGRGQGLGQRLVGECIAFAKACGYRRITLWTQSNLVAARKIYQEAGFKLVATEPHRSFGQSLIGETWELEL